jgi:hypothetical protein
VRVVYSRGFLLDRRPAFNVKTQKSATQRV